MKKPYTPRQKLLKLMYPLWMFYARLTGTNSGIIENKKKMTPIEPFYDLSIQLNNGEELHFKNLEGKNILLVNTASDCGYTDQYAALQKLSEKYKNDLVVIGFPANDFKDQEKGNDQEIAQFCQLNFNLKFPLAKKSRVKKGTTQNEVFKWLTHKKHNGWNDKQPSWNFCKYLVNKDGTLTHYFGSSISPLDKKLTEAIQQSTTVLKRFKDEIS